MKKFVSSLLMMCCIALGVAQAQNLGGIQVNTANTSNLQFANEQMMRDGEWISYAGDEVLPETLIGIGMPFYWGYMFPSFLLTNYAGTQITQVAYVDPGDPQFGGIYEVCIYLGGDAAPETQVVRQSFEVTGLSGDIEVVVLDTPVTIDGLQNVWVCFYQDGSVEYPAVVMADMGEPNARWMGVDGYGWMDMASVGGDGYAFILWAYVEEGDAIGEFNSNVAVYPNPTNSNVTVAAPGMNHITVLNTLGQVVYDTPAEESAILDMSQYQAGVYMVRVAGENGVSVQRVTVTK